MRVPHQRLRIPAREPYRSPRIPAAQFPANLRAHMMRWQMPGAKKGTQWPGKLAVDEFSYSTDIITLAATNGANVTTLLTTDKDSFFDISKRAAAAVVGGNPAHITVTMFDAASQRELLQATPLSCFAGIGGLPYGLGQIKMLAPAQTVGIRFEYAGTTVPATDCTIQLTFTGRKVFIRDY